MTMTMTAVVALSPSPVPSARQVPPPPVPPPPVPPHRQCRRRQCHTVPPQPVPPVPPPPVPPVPTASVSHATQCHHRQPVPPPPPVPPPRRASLPSGRGRIAAPISAQEIGTRVERSFLVANPSNGNEDPATATGPRTGPRQPQTPPQDPRQPPPPPQRAQTHNSAQEKQEGRGRATLIPETTTNFCHPSATPHRSLGLILRLIPYCIGLSFITACTTPI
nr:formin-like protein 3 [Penaeus vannamei]